MKRRRKVSGFTLIEVIAVLLLIGIGAVFAGMMLPPAMQSYLLGKEAGEDSQKVQVAMNRIIKEITWAEPDTLEFPDSRTLKWTPAHPDRAGEEGLTLHWSGTAGDDLTLDNITLLDGVAHFQVTGVTDDDSEELIGVAVELRTTATPGALQKTTIYPR